MELSEEQEQMMRYLEQSEGIEAALTYKALVTHPSYLSRKTNWRGNSIKLKNYDRRGKKAKKEGDLA